LRNAADYNTSLPKEQSELAQWQVATEALILMARGGPTMLASIDFIKALNRNVVLAFNPDAKSINVSSRLNDTRKQDRRSVTPHAFADERRGGLVRG
jgi:hypothetical protein